MDVQELLNHAIDTVNVRRVFGEPIERDGSLVIPVARVYGMGGGGGGSAPEQGSGSGAGLGFRASPAGVYVVRDGDVTWRPAVDVTRIALGGQLVAVVLLLTLRSLARRRRRRRG
jgi:uncharacterized spore protein YtfJ